jgi:hypothetical protein
LSFICGFKTGALQINGHEAMQFSMVEKQVNIIIFTVNNDAFLTVNKREILVSDKTFQVI